MNNIKKEIEIVGKIGSLNHPYFYFAQNLTEMDADVN